MLKFKRTVVTVEEDGKIKKTSTIEIQSMTSESTSLTYLKSFYWLVRIAIIVMSINNGNFTYIIEFLKNFFK